MAVETHQVLAKSGRGHEARLSDRSGMGSGKVSGQTPQSSDFLGLLASMQSEDSDISSSGQQDSPGFMNLLGADQHQLGAVQQESPNLSSTPIANGESDVASLAPSFFGHPAWGVEGKVGAVVGNGSPTVEILGSNLGQPNGAKGSAEAPLLLPTSELGSDVLLAGANAVLGRDGGVSLLDESASKTLGKGGHGKLALASPAGSMGESRIQAPVVHWSRALGDSGSTMATADGLRTQLDQGRQSNPQVFSAKEISVFPRSELATTVLFGSGELRPLTKDEYVKAGRDASFVSVTTSETEGFEASPEFKVLDPSEAANVEEDPARYWLCGETRHAAELTVEEMAGGPVEISIQLQGNEAMIDFKAEGLEARDALLSGSGDLEKLLGQEGMVLGGLSVGSSGAHGGGRNGDDNAASRLNRPPTTRAIASMDGQGGGLPPVRRPQGVVDHFV